MDQIFLTPQLDARVNGFVDLGQNLFVLAVGIMVLGNQDENVVDVNLHLPDQFHLKDNVIIDVFPVSVLPGAILLVEVNVFALIVLKSPFRHALFPLKFIKGSQHIFQPQNAAIEYDKRFLFFSPSIG